MGMLCVMGTELICFDHQSPPVGMVLIGEEHAELPGQAVQEEKRE